MAATNYTPIQLYYSTTASAAPTAGNLVNGELAINITDGKLYYKDNGGVVQVIATKGAGTIGGSNTQIQFNDGGALAGNAGMVFNKTTGVTTLTTLNLTNALGATYGGTAQSTYAQGDILYASAANTLAKLGIGTTNYILTSTGSVPQWVAPTSVTVQTANNLAGGAAGSVPYQSAADTTTFLAIGAANRVMTSTGSAPQWVTSLTGLTGVSSSSMTNTSLTSGRLVYSGASGVQTDSANLTFNGTTLSAGGFSTSGNSTLVRLVTIGDSGFTTGAVLGAATPAKLYIGAGAVTDGSSAGGATNTLGAIASFSQTQVIATNANVTYTNLATLYVAGAPTAGTNVTITNPYSLYIAGGASYLGGATTFNSTTQFNGVATHSANVLFSADNTYDLGASGATRPRTGYFGTSVVAPTFVMSGLTAGRVVYTTTSGQLTDSNSLTFDGSQLFVNGITVGRGTGSVATNTAVGASALSANTTGSRNTAFGSTALAAVTTGSWNVAIGSQSLQTIQTGDFNIAVGGLALAAANGCSFNVAMGQTALTSNTLGSNNTAIGYDALRSNTTTSNNTAVGYQAGYANTTGSVTALGQRALFANTTGADNVAVGVQALASNTTGNTNTAVGHQALTASTTAGANTAVGYLAGTATTTGGDNTAIGYAAMRSNTTGSANTAVGEFALFTNTTQTYNTAIGLSALYTNNEAFNVAVGDGAGYSNTTGGITAIGSNVLYANTTGEANVAVGGRVNGLALAAMVANTTGSYNVAVGASALSANTTASQNVAVGSYALRLNTTAPDNSAFGHAALYSSTTGAYNTALGSQALFNNTTASYNTAVGFQAAYNSTTGTENTIVGQGALYANTTGSYNTALGSNALRLNTGSSNTAIGRVAMYNNSTGANNTAVGHESLPANTTGDNNTAVGTSALFSNTTGTLNTALGMYALRLNVAGTRNTAVGYNALQNYTASGQADNVAVGLNAMNAVASGTANTAIGNYALGSNATSTGSANSAVGTYALQATTSGSSNTAMGFQAGYSLTTGSRNVFIGRNTAFGLSSGSENTVIGPPNGSDNGVGYSLTSGSTNTLLGINAALNLTSGSYNTIVGGYTLPTATTSYAVALADGSGNARFLYLNSTSAQARYASNETMLSYVSANQGGVLRHRNIPVLGNPNGGTYKGYLILAKAYDGVVGQALSNVLGRFIFVRGGTGSGNRSSVFDVNCATAYSVTTVGISGLDQGDYAQRIVTCTYDSEQWIALETSQTGGGPDGGVFFEGTFQDAGMVYVDATYVSLISEFNSSTGLNVTNFGSTLLLNSGQIQFPATQVASSNANTLDDYEEGDFTPTYFGSTSAGTTTYTEQIGRYTKIGRQVTVNFSVGVSNATGTGDVRIGGLPFTSNSAMGFVGTCMASNLTWTGDYLSSYLDGGAVAARIYRTTAGAGLNDVSIDTACNLYGTITYIV